MTSCFQGSAQVVDVFAADPSLVKVQYAMEVIDQAGRRTGVVLPLPHFPKPNGDVRRQELTFPFDMPWMATSGNAFAASALRQIFPIPAPEDDYRLAADWYLVHLTALLGRVATLPYVGALRRFHDANLFEARNPDIDLVQIRQAIICATHTERHLRQLAQRLNLLHHNDPLLSVSDIARRLLSLRLDPSGHPVSTDTVGCLTWLGAKSALRHFDIRGPLRALYVLWFALAAIAPKGFVLPLGELFIFPERRSRLNRALGVLRKYESR